MYNIYINKLTFIRFYCQSMSYCMFTSIFNDGPSVFFLIRYLQNNGYLLYMFFRVLYEWQGIQYFLCYLLNMNFKYNFSFEELTMQGTALNKVTEAFFSFSHHW